MNAAVSNLRTAINHTESLVGEIARHVTGSPVGDTDRERLSRLLWQQVIEDGLAIPALVERRYLGSARALVRPQFEALVRSAWVRVRATDNQLSRYSDGTRAPDGIASLVQMLSAHSTGWTVQGVRIPFDSLWAKVGHAFHDTAHRGTRAIARLALANQGSEDHVADDEIVVLYLAGSCAGIAGTALLDSAGRGDLANTAWERTDQFMKALEQSIQD